MEKISFYWEWLPLPKAEFNVLTMIADHGGAFSGNYAEMCRYLNVTTQDSNRKVLQRAIESLATKGFITWETSGRTQKLNIIPKEKEVCLPCEWVRSVVRHDYTSESVAFAQVLKLFIHNFISFATNSKNMILGAVFVAYYHDGICNFFTTDFFPCDVFNKIKYRFPIVNKIFHVNSFASHFILHFCYFEN